MPFYNGSAITKKKKKMISLLDTVLYFTVKTLQTGKCVGFYFLKKSTI